MYDLSRADCRTDLQSLLFQPRYYPLLSLEAVIRAHDRALTQHAIDAARRLAAEERLEQGVEFHVGDVHSLEYADSQFSAVVAHTLISHVTDPLTVLKETAGVVAPDRVIALFDGDYASWTFSYPDAVLAKAMEEALVAPVVNNPRVMRDMPRLLLQAGLERIETLAYVYADIGAGHFYAGAIEAYAPLVVRAGLLPADQVEMWLREQR